MENGKIIVKVDAEIQDMVPAFLDNRKKDVMTIAKALEIADFLTVQSIAHGMKGCGTSYGFEPITLFGAAMEQAAKEKKAAVIADNAKALAHYLQNVEVIYE